MICKERTQSNLKLIEEINNYGYPVDIIDQMIRWQSRSYTQLRLFA